MGRIRIFKMKIKIDIHKLAENDREHMTSFGSSKLGWFLENFLLPITCEEMEEFFPEGSLIDETYIVTELENLLIDSLENIFDTEYRKEDVKGKKPGESEIKNLANEFIPFLYADIGKATIEYDTNTNRWKMK